MKIFSIAWIIFISIAISSVLKAQIPRQVSYQGLLSDSSGNFKPDGPYSIAFRLYSSATGGSPLWSEAKTLQVKRGLFTTILGDVTAFPGSVRFDRQYWLSIQLSGEAELAQRLQFTPVPYSLTSLMSDTASYALSAPRQTYTDTAGIVVTIPVNSIDSEKIIDGSISTGDIRDNSITSAKIDTTGLRVTAAIPDNSITEQVIAPNQVVKSLNGLHDGIILSAQGGATVSSSGDTITINAGSGGGGTGIQGVQNTNNTLDILNPNGPTATINVKSLGITGAHIADGAIDSNKLGSSAVTTSKLADAAVTQSKIANGVNLPPGGTAGGDLSGTYPNPSIGSNVIGTLNIQNGTILRADVDPNFKAPKADTADYVKNGSTLADSARIAGIVPDNTIVDAKIQNGTITQSKLAFTPGTVTSIATGSGLTGGPISTSGTISITAGGVTNGMLQNSSISLNPGPGLSGGGGVSLGGTTSLRMPLSGVTAGTYAHATIRVDSLGIVDSAASVPTDLGTAEITGTLTVDHGGTGTATPFNAGSVVFANAAGAYTQDNANFFWNNITKRLGIGTSAPAGRLQVDQTEWSSNPVLIKGQTGVVIGPTIEMDATDGVGGERYSIISTNSGAAAGAGKFSIYHNGPSGSGYNFVINNTGDVGIGVTNPNSRLHVNGSVSTALITAAADLTLGDSHSVVLCDGPAGTPLNINLPSAVGIAGRQYTLKNIAANSAVNIKPFNTESIDGTGGYALPLQFKYVVLISNGADWFIVGNN